MKCMAAIIRSWVSEYFFTSLSAQSWQYCDRKWNESGFRPPLCTYRLNWARRTSWGWWDDWDDTVLISDVQNNTFILLDILGSVCLHLLLVSDFRPIFFLQIATYAFILVLIQLHTVHYLQRVSDIYHLLILEYILRFAVDGLLHKQFIATGV